MPTQPSIRKKISATLMILSLVWLTVSLPVVYNSMVIAETVQDCETNEDGSPCEEVPVPTEEKTSSVNSAQEEEYLHGMDENLWFASIFLTYNAGDHPTDYTAFHGELLSPPPESLS